MHSPPIFVEGICKRFGREQVVDDVTLSVGESEYLCILGASGSGKTTLLRLVAGLERPDAGRIVLHGKDITYLRPHARGIPLVFQHLSLWPHMNVLEQIVFGLEERGTERRAARRAAFSAIERVNLSGLESRLPGELSGGQQQRAALARALVLDARVILLDEPLANLDAHLRNEMHALLRRLPAEFGVTVLHVTHDRDDAFELADRIAILDSGRIVACDTPGSLYRHPPTSLAASLLGEVNRLAGRVASIEPEGVVMETGLGIWRSGTRPEGLEQGDKVALLFRPESVKTTPHDFTLPDQGNFFPARVIAQHFAGPLAVLRLSAPVENSDHAVLFTRFAFECPEQGALGEDCKKYRVSFSDVSVVRDE